MASQASVQSSLWFDQDDQSRLSSRLKQTLVLSFIIHVVVVLVAVGLRLPQHGERPLTSVEVSLVSLPTPARQAESAKPVESATVSDSRPAPAPLVKAVAPSAAPSAAPPIGERRRDMLRDLQLPPDAPKFGDLSPATKSVAQPQQAAKALDIPRVPDAAQDQVARIPQRSTVSDDLNRELEEELKKIKQFQPAAKLDIQKEVKSSEASVKPAPQQEVKIPAVKTPETTLKISGTAGSNPYWARAPSRHIKIVIPGRLLHGYIFDRPVTVKPKLHDHCIGVSRHIDRRRLPLATNNRLHTSPVGVRPSRTGDPQGRLWGLGHRNFHLLLRHRLC